MKRNQRVIKRILKVNHAGEYGAIRIYKAQIFMASLFYKDLVPVLSDMLGHEINHCKIFKGHMVARRERPCLTMWLWSYGGFILGAITALMGRNMIMVCTEAVEDAVHKHMDEQINFLKSCDPLLMKDLQDIQTEELSHLKFAQDQVSHNIFTKFVSIAIGGCDRFNCLFIYARRFGVSQAQPRGYLVTILFSVEFLTIA